MVGNRKILPWASHKSHENFLLVSEVLSPSVSPWVLIKWLIISVLVTERNSPGWHLAHSNILAGFIWCDRNMWSSRLTTCLHSLSHLEHLYLKPLCSSVVCFAIPIGWKVVYPQIWHSVLGLEIDIHHIYWEKKVLHTVKMVELTGDVKYGK